MSILQRAATEIAYVFPKENSTIYFMDYKPKITISPKQCCSGKSYSKYVNTKAALRKCAPLNLVQENVENIDRKFIVNNTYYFILLSYD